MMIDYKNAAAAASSPTAKADAAEFEAVVGSLPVAAVAVPLPAPSFGAHLIEHMNYPFKKGDEMTFTMWCIDGNGARSMQAGYSLPFTCDYGQYIKFEDIGVRMLVVRNPGFGDDDMQPAVTYVQFVWPHKKFDWHLEYRKFDDGTFAWKIVKAGDEVSTELRNRKWVVYWNLVKREQTPQIKDSGWSCVVS